MLTGTGVSKGSYESGSASVTYLQEETATTQLKKLWQVILIGIGKLVGSKRVNPFFLLKLSSPSGAPYWQTEPNMESASTKKYCLQKLSPSQLSSFIHPSPTFPDYCNSLRQKCFILGPKNILFKKFPC